MKRLLLAVALILGLAIPCSADSNLIVTWNRSPESDLKEYRLYQSNVSGAQNPKVDIPIAVIPAGTETVAITVEDGIWYWILTAVGQINIFNHRYCFKPIQ